MRSSLLNFSMAVIFSAWLWAAESAVAADDLTKPISVSPDGWQATLTTDIGAVITPVGVNIVRVEGGKFREVRAYFDSSILR